jgi:signal transduction histidine kinase
VRILVAEDEPVARLVIEAAIRKLGHEALGAVDGQQAWELLQSAHVDVIISDWRMPHVDGQELCKRVRSFDDSRSYIPFIFLTALDTKRHALMAMEAGADDYLVKPLNIDDLHARLIAAQRLKRVEDERRHLLIHERRARGEAEAAVRARDEVLAAVSHDLRTPLTAIHALGQLLHKRLAKLEPESQAAPLMQFADRIVDSAIRMNTWIDDLMAATRPDTGEPAVLNPVHLDLVDLVQRAVDDHQATTGRHQIGLLVEQASLMGMWDKPQLRRAVDNLLSNAIKYSPGGGPITVTLEECPALTGSSVELRVRDTGMGIPASDLASVFDRYQRASNVGCIAGQGIGLAGARQIVEQHGGTVTVQSREGTDTTFTVRLPVINYQGL